MCFTCPSHTSPANRASGYTRRRHVTGLTEAACWLLLPDSPFRVSWECKQPLGDRFNHVCIFLPQFSFSGRFFLRLSSFKPQLYISLHTNTFFFCAGSLLARAELAHRGFQWHLEPSKKAVVCFCAESESAVVKAWLGNTENVLLDLFQHRDSHLSGLKRSVQTQTLSFIQDSSSGFKHFYHSISQQVLSMCCAMTKLSLPISATNCCFTRFLRPADKNHWTMRCVRHA